MKVNHINLTVTDVPASVALLETYFGLRRTRMDNASMAFMRDDNDMFVSMFKGKDAEYPRMFHIGFTQDTREEVDAIHRKLVEGGFAPGEPMDDHGRWTFYLNAPGGFVIEVQTFLNGGWY